jgi:hypothetical protein
MVGPVYCGECPLLLFTVLDTEREGEYAFAEVMEERTSYGLRDQGRDWVGTSAGLWTIAAAVYMSLMGPEGFRELGDTILKRSHYAAGKLAAIPGVKQLFAGVLQGVREPRRRDHRRRRQPAAQARHLRCCPSQQFPSSGRLLVCVTSPHAGRHRPPARRSVKRSDQARAQEGGVTMGDVKPRLSHAGTSRS